MLFYPGRPRRIKEYGRILIRFGLFVSCAEGVLVWCGKSFRFVSPRGHTRTKRFPVRGARPPLSTGCHHWHPQARIRLQNTFLETGLVSFSLLNQIDRETKLGPDTAFPERGDTSHRAGPDPSVPLRVGRRAHDQVVARLHFLDGPGA